MCEHTYIKCVCVVLTLQVLSINEEGLRRCEENTKVFGRPIRYTPCCYLVVAPPLPLIGQVEFKPYCIHLSRPLRSTGHKFLGEGGLNGNDFYGTSVAKLMCIMGIALVQWGY